MTLLSPLSKILKVGSRCEVEPGGKRGVVKFVGQAESLGSGFWVGVQYDEPLGKHDGMYVKLLPLYMICSSVYLIPDHTIIISPLIYYVNFWLSKVSEYAYLYLRISLGDVTGSKEYATSNAPHLMVQ